MLKRNVIKITVCAVALFAYALGCVSASRTGFSGSLGFFFWENDGVLCLLNSFIWFFALFLLGMSLIGFFGVLPVVYFKMYSLGFAVTSVSCGSSGLVCVLSLLPEVMLLFFIFTEMGSGAISFSLYILQRLSLLPKRREQTLLPGEKITFREYIWGSVFVFFLATVLVVYENTVIVLL